MFCFINCLEAVYGTHGAQAGLRPPRSSCLLSLVCGWGRCCCCRMQLSGCGICFVFQPSLPALCGVRSVSGLMLLSPGEWESGAAAAWSKASVQSLAGRLINGLAYISISKNIFKLVQELECLKDPKGAKGPYSDVIQWQSNLSQKFQLFGLFNWHLEGGFQLFREIKFHWKSMGLVRF